jgi:transcriptional regulator with XRE-family HTH domain
MTANMHEMDIHIKDNYSRGGFAAAPDVVHTKCIMNISRLRKAKGLTQNDLAEMTGITQASISRAENGDDGVTLGNYKSIAAALNVRLSDLFADNRSAVEQAILTAYRELPPDRQKGWQDALGIAEGLQAQKQ